MQKNGMVDGKDGRSHKANSEDLPLTYMMERATWKMDKLRSKSKRIQ